MSQLEEKLAIKSLPTGKPPGVDGFSIQFFQCFADFFSPFLTLLYNNIIN